MRNALAYRLQDGTEIVLQEITPSEMVTAAKLAGNEQAAAVRILRIARAALPFALRKVGERDVTQAQARAELGTLLPRTRQMTESATRWIEMHHPTDAEYEALEAGAVCEVGAEGELWTFTLPAREHSTPARIVTMVDVGQETVEAALREASLAAKSEAAQGFLSLIAGASRALRTVDGKPVTAEALKGPKWDALFSVRETHLLGRCYQQVHGTGALPSGEATPVPVS